MSYPGTNHVSVMVAVPTCGRPRSLEHLLRSLMAQALPDESRVCVLVVENGRDGAGEAVAASYRDIRAEMPVSTCVEAESGIPFARNRALDAAREAGTDILLFLDDDEVAEQDWLRTIVDHARETRAHLIGGPVYAMRPAGTLTPWQAYLFRGVERWYEVRQRRNRRQAAKGRARRPVVLTNNWLLDMSFQQQKELRFDERFRISGGSDADFHAQAISSGAVVSWCDAARVREIIDPRRLTAGYIVGRSRQQALSHFERRKGYGRLVPSLRQLVAVPFLFLFGLLRLATAPLAGPYGVVDGLRLIGRAWGKALSVFGVPSQLYKIGTASDPLD